MLPAGAVTCPRIPRHPGHRPLSAGPSTITPQPHPEPPLCALSTFTNRFVLQRLAAGSGPLTLHRDTTVTHRVGQVRTGGLSSCRRAARQLSPSSQLSPAARPSLPSPLVPYPLAPGVPQRPNEGLCRSAHRTSPAGLTHRITGPAPVPDLTPRPLGQIRFTDNPRDATELSGQARPPSHGSPPGQGPCPPQHPGATENTAQPPGLCCCFLGIYRQDAHKAKGQIHGGAGAWGPPRCPPRCPQAIPGGGLTAGGTRCPRCPQRGAPDWPLMGVLPKAGKYKPKSLVSRADSALPHGHPRDPAQPREPPGTPDPPETPGDPKSP